MINFRRRRRVTAGLGLALASAMALSACGGGDSSSGSGSGESNELAANQELTIAVSNMPASLDPMAVLGANPRRYDIYEALFDYDPQTAAIKPMLATEWTQETPTTVRIKLRTDAKFSDGTPFTAEDVQFSLDRAARDENPLATNSILDSYAQTEIVDDHTVIVHTTTPDAMILSKLARIAMLPKAYYNSLGATDADRDAAFAEAPIGTGPYKVESHDTTQVVLVQNEQTWRDPILTKVTVRNITDPASQIAAFTSGQAQYINLVPLTSVKQLEATGATLLTYRAGNSLGAFMDTVDSTGAPKTGPMGDKRVRQAINHAIDRETLVKDVLQGLTETDKGQLASPKAFGHNSSITDYTYDVALAERLLDEAGYPKGADGTRFTITMASAFAGPGSVRRLIGEFVQNQLSKVGINVQYETLTDPTLQSDLFYGRKPRQDIFHYGLFTRPYMDPAGAYNWFRSTNSAKHYNNPEFDQLYVQQQQELDPAKREQLLARMAEILHEDAPYLFLTQDVWIDAAKPNLKGVIVSEVETEQYLDQLYFTK